MMCEYCDGSKKPIVDVDGDGFDGGIAKVVGAELLVNWGDRLDRKGPMFVFKINVCPMCGRELGGGTLTADDVLNAVYKHGARWQAVADELNAALGCGECEDISTKNGIFKCSECGCTVEEDGVDWGEIHYCPDYGKEVKR